MRSPRDVGVHRDSVSNACHAQRDQNITQTQMHSEKAPSFGRDLCTGCVLQCTSTVLRESTMQVYDNREQQSNTVLFFSVDIVVAREGGENAREHFTSFKKSYVNVQVVGGKKIGMKWCVTILIVLRQM